MVFGLEDDSFCLIFFKVESVSFFFFFSPQMPNRCCIQLLSKVCGLEWALSQGAWGGG